MMRTRQSIILHLFLAFAGVPAMGAENEVKLGVTSAVRYNDNVANVEKNKIESFSFEIGPSIRYERTDAKYEAGAFYSPRYATYSESGRDDTSNHNFGIHADFRPSSRWNIGFRDTFGLEFDADRDFDDNLSDDSTGSEKQTLRNYLDGTVVYSISQRTRLSTKLGYNLTDREDKDLSSNSQISGRVGANHELSSRNTLGGGALARSQSITAGRNDNNGDSQNDYYGFYVYGEHRFSPLLTMSGSGGPTWLVSNRDGDGRDSETSLDYFASAELTAEIDRGAVAISYQRSSSDFASSTTAFTIDEVAISVKWGVTSLLGLSVNAEWNTRKAILKVLESNEIDEVDQWRATATASYRNSPELSTHVTFDYLRQESKQAESNADKIDRYRVVMRFDYNINAFRF